MDAGGELPVELEHVWAWFLDLASVRVEHRPITNSELFSFFTLRRIAPTQSELEALQVLDREWILHKANSQQNKG